MNVFIAGLALGVLCWALALLYICVRWLGLRPRDWAHALRISWEGRIEKWMVWQGLCFLFLGQMLAVALWTFKIYPF
jgi:hypothetical protein